MPTKELATTQVVELIMHAAISSETTTNSSIVDTQGFNSGVTFAVGLTTFATGTFTLKLEHGDDPALSDAEDVPDEMLIYKIPIVLTSGIAAGGVFTKEAAFSTKRYLRAAIVSTGSVDATATITAIKTAGSIPTPQNA